MEDKDIIKHFFESKKNANCILDIEKGLLSEDEDFVLSSMDIVLELFSKIFEKHMLLELASEDDSEKKFREWLLDRYDDFIGHLCTYLNHDNGNIQVKAFEVLMKFVALEGKFPLIKLNSDDWYFPKLLFKRLISQFLSDILNQHNLIMKFKPYASFNDIRMYTLKAFIIILSGKQQVNDIFLSNSFFVLNVCSPSEISCSPENTFLAQEGVAKPFEFKKNVFSKIFSTAWSDFLKCELPTPILNKVLLVLPKRVLQHYQNPCLLTDFLTDLYNKGGLNSLLALSGLFELMQKYNVEYPDFYKKFYLLFNVNIVNGKYHPKFFHLADLFLSSTHLPASMVAAFIKKLSRVSLRSNSESLVKLLPLICNLLIRHPTLHILVHRIEPKELSEDPFDCDAIDPSDSKAMESSLWEIKDLKSHYHPKIAQKEKITNEIPKLEFDLSDVLDTTIDSLYVSDRKRKLPIPTTMEKIERKKNLMDFSSNNYT